MEKRQTEEVIKTWIKLTKSKHDSEEYHYHFWAFDYISLAVHREPEEAWKIILGILKADSSDIILQNLSAGPLEDLLVFHGKDFIERIKQEVTSNKMFAKLIGGVWKNVMEEDIWNQVQSLQAKYSEVY